jgi:hypothetical protein
MHVQCRMCGAKHVPEPQVVGATSSDSGCWSAVAASCAKHQRSPLLDLGISHHARIPQRGPSRFVPELHGSTGSASGIAAALRKERDQASQGIKINGAQVLGLDEEARADLTHLPARPVLYLEVRRLFQGTGRPIADVSMARLCHGRRFDRARGGIDGHGTMGCKY